MQLLYTKHAYNLTNCWYKITKPDFLKSKYALLKWTEGVFDIWLAFGLWQFG
uniref:Uncharacterized protein n=1 Tax=Arundo donax TaxID=35708 RepID=A0A0A9EB15_ARUDO